MKLTINVMIMLTVMLMLTPMLMLVNASTESVNTLLFLSKMKVKP